MCHLFVALEDFIIDHVQGSLEDRITEEAYDALVRKRNTALQSIPNRHSDFTQRLLSLQLT